MSSLNTVYFILTFGHVDVKKLLGIIKLRRAFFVFTCTRVGSESLRVLSVSVFDVLGQHMDYGGIWADKNYYIFPVLRMNQGSLTQSIMYSHVLKSVIQF